MEAKQDIIMKKAKRINLIFIFAVCMLIFISGCASSFLFISYAAEDTTLDDAVDYTTFNFDYNDGVSEQTTVYVSNADLPYLLPAPEREGYTFAGWYDLTYEDDPSVNALHTAIYVEDLAVWNLTAKWYEGEVDYNYEINDDVGYIAYSFSAGYDQNEYIHKQEVCTITGNNRVTLYLKSEELILALEYFEADYTEEDIDIAKEAILTSIEENICSCTAEQAEIVMEQSAMWLAEITIDTEYDSQYDLKRDLYDIYMAGVDFSQAVVAREQLLVSIESEYSEIVSKTGFYGEEGLIMLESGYEEIVASLAIAETIDEVIIYESGWESAKNSLEEYRTYTTFIFDYNDGEREPETVYVIDSDTPYELPEPEREGYIFVCWYYYGVADESNILMDVCYSGYNQYIPDYEMTAVWIDAEEYYLAYSETNIAHYFSIGTDSYMMKTEIYLICEYADDELAEDTLVADTEWYRFNETLYSTSDTLSAAVENIDLGYTEDDLTTAKEGVLASIEELMDSYQAEQEIIDKAKELTASYTETLLAEITIDNEYDSQYALRYLFYDIYIAGVDYSEVAMAISEAIATIDTAYGEKSTNSADYTEASFASFEDAYIAFIASLEGAETYDAIDSFVSNWSDVEDVLVYQYMEDIDTLFGIIDSDYAIVSELSEYYTVESFEAFEASYSSFVERLELAESVTEVDELESEWETIMQALEFQYEYDRSILVAEMDSYYEEILAASSDYTTASFAEFESSYEAIITSLDSVETVEEVAEQATNWNAAKLLLVYQYVEDIDTLFSVIDSDYAMVSDASGDYTTESFATFETSYSSLVERLEVAESVSAVAELATEWEAILLALELQYEYDRDVLLAIIESEYAVINADSSAYTTASFATFESSYDAIIASLDEVETVEEVEEQATNWNAAKLLLASAYAEERDVLLATIESEYSNIAKNSEYYTAETMAKFEYQYEQITANLQAVESLEAVEAYAAAWSDIKSALEYYYPPSEDTTNNFDIFLADPTEENLQTTKEQIVTDVSTYLRACDGAAVSEVLSITATRLDEIELGDGTAESIADNLYAAYFDALQIVQLANELQAFIQELTEEFDAIYYSGTVSKQSLIELEAAYSGMLSTLENVSQLSELTACQTDWGEVVADLKQLTLFSGEDYTYSEEGFLMEYELNITKNEANEASNAEYSTLGIYTISISDAMGEKITLDTTIKVGIKIEENINIYSAKVIIYNESGEAIYVDAEVENGYIIFYTDTLGDIEIVYEETLSIYIYIGIIAALLAIAIIALIAKSKLTPKTK